MASLRIIVPAVLAFVALAAACKTCEADYLSTVLADSPHAYWRLGEGSGTQAVDEIGVTPGTHPGTYLFGPTLGVAGIPVSGGNTAVGFDGINQFVRAPDATDPTRYTIEAWVKPNAAATTSSVIMHRTDPAEGGAHSHELRILGDGRFQHYSFAGAAKTVTSATTAQAGQWYHVVGVYSPTSGGSNYMDVYVNGILGQRWTGGGLGAPWTGGDRWVIGHAAGGLNYFDGTIDEVAVYPSELSPGRVADHYFAGAGEASATISTFSDANDLDLDGDIIYAVNLSDDAGPRPVRGVNFLSTDGVNGGGDDVPGVVVNSLSLSNNWSTRPDYGGGDDNNVLEEIMHDIRWSTSPAAMTIDADVTAGKTYQLQLLLSENIDRSAGARTFDIAVEGLRVADEFDITAIQGDWTGTPTVGALLTYVFTAGDTNLDIDFLPGTDAADNNPILQAFTLELVPEPSAFLLAALGLLSLGILARRRRQRE